MSICSQFLGDSGRTKSYKLTCLIHILDNESGVSKLLADSDPGRKIQLFSKFTPHHPINHIISTGVSTGNTEFWFGFNAVSRRHFQYCSRLNFYFCCWKIHTLAIYFLAEYKNTRNCWCGVLDISGRITQDSELWFQSLITWNYLEAFLDAHHSQLSSAMN